MRSIMGLMAVMLAGVGAVRYGCLMAGVVFRRVGDCWQVRRYWNNQIVRPH
ncbi:hypothetical protein KCP76_06210 [Salmonella enterica subsp. enterica serovar Weltevreden]|nr:hypothetical protein KCP76_06210 [Salmonella enterica subsp. enterica serovar Weltevreden]